MENNILRTRAVTQIGILVKDIETAAQSWADFLGVEKPEIRTTDSYEKSQASFRGKPTKARARLAFFDVGPWLQLELIQPDGEQSTWREDLDRKGEGVHHIAFEIKGMKEKLAALQGAGLALLQAGEYTGGRYAYVDGSKDLKVTTRFHPGRCLDALVMGRRAIRRAGLGEGAPPFRREEIR